VKFEIECREARMRAPVVSARGSVGIRDLVIVSLHGSDGVIGFGEAAPLPGYDGVCVEEVLGALEDCRSVLAESDGDDREELLAACRRLAFLPQAVAAIDLALWDLAGRRARQPVWQLLGAAAAPEVEVNSTIVATDRAGAAAEATAAAAAGFRCVKMKVGIGDDAGRVAAVRAADGDPARRQRPLEPGSRHRPPPGAHSRGPGAVRGAGVRH
jgi:L-Ala-D/L-Glu epimerase